MRIMGVKLRSSLVPRPSEGGGEGRPGIQCAVIITDTA